MPNQFLSHYINSLSTQGQENVATLFNFATISKDQLDVLASQITNTVATLNLTLPTQNVGNIISAGAFASNFRELTQRLNDLYRLSNNISLLLDSHQKTLNSDLQALFAQVRAMELSATNYAFLMSEGGVYDYVYSNSFHDNLSQASFTFPIPDRGQQTFNALTEQATVLTDEGVLVLPDDFTVSLSMTPTVSSSNFSTLTTSDTGINNLLTTANNTGWRVSISSPTVITTSIPSGAGYGGAQCEITFTLSQFASATAIKIIPLADSTLDLLQVRAYIDENDVIGTPLITEPQPLGQVLNLQFPLMSVQRFTLVINQSTYNRGAAYINLPEENYRRLYNAADIKDGIEFGFSQPDENPNILPIYTAANPVEKQPDLPSLLRENMTRLGAQTIWNQSSPFQSSFLNFYSQWPNLYKQLFPRSTTSNNGSFVAPVTTVDSTNMVTTLPLAVNPTVATNYNYDYLIGLKYVGVGVAVPGVKGVYVSEVLPSIGDMGVVKIRTTDANYNVSDISLDNNVATSIEYSLTNVSNPSHESDWVPILPTNVLSINSERLFPDIAGVAMLRFPADPNQIINIYKNGYKFTQATLQYNAAQTSVVAFKIPSTLYMSTDIFTTSYYPLDDQSTVNFAQTNFYNPPLISAFNSLGSGELFNETEGNNTIQLSHVPYVDQTQVHTTSYSPVTVELNDGTFVANLTNYATQEQPTFPASGYYYINTGKVLMFNQAITQTFKVYYQYLQNNVRYRVVLRCNYPLFVSPKVNLIQLKAQTRSSNPVS